MPPRKDPSWKPQPPAKKPKHKLGGGVLADDLETFATLKETYRSWKAKADEAKGILDEFERYLVERMEYERVPRQSTDERTFYLSHQPYAVVQDRDAFVSWAEGEGVDILKAPDARTGDLNSMIRRILDDGGDLPPGVGYYVKSSINSRAR